MHCCSAILPRQAVLFVYLIGTSVNVMMMMFNHSHHPELDVLISLALPASHTSLTSLNVSVALDIPTSLANCLCSIPKLLTLRLMFLFAIQSP
jgi:hypothetical protein